eukprot:gene23713-26833_t
MSDGETEDEDKPRQAPKSTDELIAEADELIVKKKARHTKPFTEDVLTHPDGLQRIYEEFPVACKFRGRGSEAKDIKKLMAMYREWAFQLHPALAFSDIISKCESLGSKGKTRYFIQNLRDRERSRYIAEVLDVVNGPREVQPTKVARTTPVQMASAEKVHTQPPIVVPASEDDVASTLSQSAVVIGAETSSPAEVQLNETSNEEQIKMVQLEEVGEEEEEEF